MLLDDAGVRVTGVSTSDRTDHGRLTWVDDWTAFDPTEQWRFGRDPATGTVKLDNLAAGTTPLEMTTADELRVTNLRVTNEVTHPLHLAATHTRVSGFDADTGYHWLHAGSGANTDRMLGIEKVTTGEYTLHLSKGDQTARLLTAADTDIDASTLDGRDSTAFVQADGSVALTGPLDAGGNALTNTTGVESAGGLTLTADADASGTGTLALAVGATTGLSVTQAGDVDVPDGALSQQGVSVATIDQTGIDAQNTDGTTLVSAAKTVTAGTDLSFADDGDGSVTLSYTGSGVTSSAAVGDQPTASGDGTQTSFTLAHSLGAVPDAVSVDPASPAASTDYRIETVTATDVTITYESPPPTGTDNLAWHVTTTASGLEAITVSNDGSIVVANPTDLNLAGGLTASDDGDTTVTLATDATVPTLDASETVTANWRFDAGVGVGADATLGVTNTSGTTQFGSHYDSTNDRWVFADVANTTDLMRADRSGTIDFQSRPTVNGTGVALANEAGGDTAATTHTASGDGSTTTFTLSHGLGAVPTGVVVTPESRAAMADRYVSAKTASDVTIEYARPPPSGTDNLQYNIVVHS